MVCNSDYHGSSCTDVGQLAVSVQYFFISNWQYVVVLAWNTVARVALDYY